MDKKKKQALQKMDTTDHLQVVIDRRCKVCNHQAVGQINKYLAEDTPNREIADTFSIPISSVQRHKNNHLSVSLRNAELERQRLLSLEVQTFDDETYLNTIDKLKLFQQSILHDLKLAKKIPVRNALYKSWLSYLQLEAKLLNLYDAPDEDKIHQYNQRCAQLTANVLRQQTNKNSVPIAQLVLDSVQEAQAIAEQIVDAFNYIYGVDVANPVEVIRILSVKKRRNGQKTA